MGLSPGKEVSACIAHLLAINHSEKGHREHDPTAVRISEILTYSYVVDQRREEKEGTLQMVVD